MYQNKSYLISTLGQKARKARTKTLNDVLKEFYPDEYIFIHEDGKCIYDGYSKDFLISESIA